MTQNPNSLARDSAVQFLYQCEAEKIFYFSTPHINAYLEYFGVDSSCKEYFGEVIHGVFTDLIALDEVIASHSKNWSISRMGVIDRVVLRMAVWELRQKIEPRNAIINEAIELAKKYGTENSGSFVNGILDAIAGEIC
jgi:N utilization substance protein B